MKPSESDQALDQTMGEPEGGPKDTSSLESGEVKINENSEISP